jgi:anti-anti-sigma factor
VLNAVAVEVPRPSDQPPSGDRDPKHQPAGPTSVLPLSIRESSPSPGVRTLQVVGEVDILTAPTLGKALLQTLADGYPRVVLDLSQVSLFAAKGVAVLTDAHELALVREVELTLVVANREVRHVLEITGVSKLLTCHTSLDTALGASG